MKPKLREWMNRYLPAEIVSSIITLLSATLAFRFTGNGLTTALIGTWAGNVSYFGYVIGADVVRVLKGCRMNGEAYTGKVVLTTAGALLLEFGLAELVDSFFIRPALMYYLPILLGNFSMGILVAKIAADVTFYIPVIVSYEFSKRYVKNAR